MQLPDMEIRAPGPVQQAVGSEAPTLAVYGSAKDLGRLTQFHRLEVLWVSGVSRQAALVLGQIPALKRLVIHDWRAPDLGALSSLTSLRELVIVGSSRLKSLEGLATLRRLRSLILFDNCGYSDLTPIESLEELETLCLEGGFGKDLRVDSLRPLRHLRRLVRLRLASIKVGDGSLKPLHDLTSLRETFVSKKLPAEELRALGRALPHGFV